MASGHHEEDLNPEHTEGFKVGEKKTIDEYQKLGQSQALCSGLHLAFAYRLKPLRRQVSIANLAADQNDESLRKWKESLGLGTGKDISDPSDPRKCIILSLGLEVEGRPDIIIDLKEKEALESLEKKPFTIKEGATFRMKVQFKVQHQVLSGLKYVQVVKRHGLSQKQQEMIVSCLATSTPHF